VQVDTSLGVVRIPAGSTIDVRMVLDGVEEPEAGEDGEVAAVFPEGVGQQMDPPAPEIVAMEDGDGLGDPDLWGGHPIGRHHHLGQVEGVSGFRLARHSQGGGEEGQGEGEEGCGWVGARAPERL
jgi:hypothetical protein